MYHQIQIEIIKGHIGFPVTYDHATIHETTYYVEITERHRPGVINRHPWHTVTGIVLTEEPEPE